MIGKSWLPVLVPVLWWPVLAQAAVINVEFKFTPYTGDLKQDHVQTVPGKARVYLNNVLLVEQPLEAGEVPVLFDDREIAPSVWLPTASLGPRLRKGANQVRFEFEPADAALAYQAQLSWASVNDQATETSSGPGQGTSTNQSGEGKEDKPAKGKVVLERAFTADFPADLPWHHYPAVTALSEDDKSRLLLLLKARAEAFKPKFEQIYTLLGAVDGVDVAKMRKAHCLDKAYAAGMRVGPPLADRIEFQLTGQPEVVVQARGDSLYAVDTELLQKKIKDEKTQFCAGLVLSAVYGPRVAAVREPSGEWKIVY
jgi:hypothetical protein